MGQLSLKFWSSVYCPNDELDKNLEEHLLQGAQLTFSWNTMTL